MKKKILIAVVCTIGLASNLIVPFGLLRTFWSPTAPEPEQERTYYLPREAFEKEEPEPAHPTITILQRFQLAPWPPLPKKLERQVRELKPCGKYFRVSRLAGTTLLTCLYATGGKNMVMDPFFSADALTVVVDDQTSPPIMFRGSADHTLVIAEGELRKAPCLPQPSLRR